jgi:hypothetical protein
LPMSNIAREWWASVGAVATAIPAATAKASNGGQARELAPTIKIQSILAEIRPSDGANCGSYLSSTAILSGARASR